MSKRISALAAVALLAVLALTGCSKSTTAPISGSSSLDVVQVNNTLTASASLVDDGLAEDGTQVSAAPAAEPTKGFTTETAIIPFAWWQTISSEKRTWSLAFADTDGTGRPTTCIATLTKHMLGSLVIVPRDPSDTTIGSATRITKALDKTWVRRVRLQRIVVTGAPVWRVTGLTGAFVETPSPTTRIVSLHVHSASGVDTTIVDPTTSFFNLRQVLAFTTQDTVTVTATTTRANDPVFLHRWDYRHRMHDNGDDTYSWTWVTSSWGGWRHFGVQAMTHGSLYDDTLPFDMQAWHLPFRVIGQQPAVDYYP